MNGLYWSLPEGWQEEGQREAASVRGDEWNLKKEKLHAQPALCSSAAGKGRQEVGWGALELCALAGGWRQCWVLPGCAQSPTPPWASVSSHGRRRGQTMALLGLLSTLKPGGPGGSLHTIGRVLG